MSIRGDRYRAWALPIFYPDEIFWEYSREGAIDLGLRPSYNARRVMQLRPPEVAGSICVLERFMLSMRLKSLFFLMMVTCVWLLPDREATGAADSLPYPPDAGADGARIMNVLRSRIEPVLDDGAKGLQSRRLAGEKAPRTLNAIVLMCDFSDSLMLGRYGQVPGEFPPPMQTDRYYAAHDSVFFQHLMGDVEDYFYEVSGGRLTVITTVHPRTVNLPDPMWFYGNHPELGEQQVRLAATLVDSLDNLDDGIDFQNYNTVILVHAGAGEETDILGNSPEQIFSTYLDPDDFAAAQRDSILDTPYIPASGFPDGTGIDRVLILPETEQQDPVGIFNGGFGSLGVYCFEVGLHLGMLSLSDFTPPGRVDSQGIGQFGLMGYGLFVGLGYIPPHPCAFNKTLMGWLDPYEAEVMAQDIWQLTPSERTTDTTACARVSITGQEYWLLEYRLQDPNGDRRFTFSNDLNGNGVPDFWDWDSANGDGTPTGKFDLATDTRERVTDAEWDFAMSENNARRPREVCAAGQPDQICDPGALAAGSGVYIWHIDEGVIQDVFNAPGNLFNADPARKSVDLEEADRIQDLDSRQPSDFMLGGDDDSYRGEGTHVFGPSTLPPTDTAGRAATGIAFSDFSKVVLDSQSYVVVLDTTTHWGYEYADTVTFSLTLEGGSGVGPVLASRREFPPDTDLTGSHVLIAQLETTGDLGQIILAGHRGEVFVVDGQLNEFLDHDEDPSTLEPFVTGSRGNEPVVWNLPPAAGDLDHDGEVEIVLSGPMGIYAFNADATGVRDVEPDAVGLYQDLPGCELPPILLPVDFRASGPEAQFVTSCVVVQEAGESSLRFYGGPDATPGLDLDLGSVRVPSVPVLAEEFLLTAVADTVDGDHYLLVLDLTPSLIPEDPLRLDLPLSREPASFPVSWGLVPGSSASDAVYYAIIVDRFGHGETVFFDGVLRKVRDNMVWDEEVEIHSPLAVGGAFVGEDILGRTGHTGYWQDGWPRRPLESISAVDGPGAGSPLVAELVDASHQLDQYIFPTRDGRLYGLGTQGESQKGWPVGGPARSAGSPALGKLTGEALLDLAAVGSFPRITGADTTGLYTEYTSTVTVWKDVALTGSVWPMAGGSPWRNGSFDSAGWVTMPIPLQGTGLVVGSHHCYPSPLESGPLYVRGQVHTSGRARAYVYNLEGEEVVASGWQDVAAVEPFVIEIALNGAATGLYLCRLVVESQDGGTDYSVVQFAVVH
jgi:M6 family metalloprotease-like protein